MAIISFIPKVWSKKILDGLNKALIMGALYRFAGFDIYKSSDLTDQVFALTPGAVQLAQKIVTEIYRPELALATCVKAYSLAGAKVVIPGAVACYYIS